MGNLNHIVFFRRYVLPSSGPVLEVGSSKKYSAIDYREHFPKTPFTGLDLFPGEGVDVVGDLSKDLCGLKPASFGLVICCSVLEHVEQPFRMAENILQLLSPEGSLYVSVPWVHRYHACPEDYWRFSWQGIKLLFPGILWLEKMYSTTVLNEFVEADRLADERLSYTIGDRKYLPHLTLHMLGRLT